MRRWLLCVAGVLSLVTIGGQCRGSLAQGRTLETIGSGPVYVDDNKVYPDGTHLSTQRKVVRTTPMTAAEWTATYDACVKTLGQPIILAGRYPGISAGVGCLYQE